MTMVRIVCLIPAAALLVPAAVGQEKADAEARARAVAPFLDPLTLAVVRLDLARLDADALIEALSSLGKAEAKDLAAPRRQLRGQLAALNKLGVRELYLVLGLNDRTGPSFVVVPRPAGADDQAVGAAVAALVQVEGVERHGPVLVVGRAAARQPLA